MHTRIAVKAAALGVGLSVVLDTVSAAASPRSHAGRVDLTVARLPKHTSSSTNSVWGFPLSWGLTRHDLLLIGAGLLIALLLLVVLVLRVRRRRRAAVARVSEGRPRTFPQSAQSWRGTGLAEEPTGPLPKFQSATVLGGATPETGWHPVPGDSSRIAYWDGAGWSAYQQWDGQRWVEPFTSNAQ